MTENVAIAGGGASGLLCARALLERSSAVRVQIYEPRELGVGLAYSTRCPGHVLNVPAEHISAFPHVADDFVRYLEQRHGGEYSRRSFVPRYIFGQYLTAIANETLVRFASRFTHIRARLDSIENDVDTLVLATGNESPAGIPTLKGATRILNDPWDAQGIAAVPRDAKVVIAGSGLTAIDILLTLRANGHAAPVRFISRNGRLPHEHRDVSPVSAHIDTTSLRTLLRTLRSAGRNWRAAIDSLRPQTNALWQNLSHRERTQFMRHLAPFWNVHRHRMAPEIAFMLATERANGTLSVQRSSLSAAAERGELDGAIVINATGPDQQLLRTRNPLLRTLLDRGAIVPGHFGMGAAADAHGALLNRDGVPSAQLFAIGPLRAGTLLETTAIPEIRQQAVALASHLVNRSLSEKRAVSV